MKTPPPLNLLSLMSTLVYIAPVSVSANADLSFLNPVDGSAAAPASPGGCRAVAPPKTEEELEDWSTCGLYMAESAIPHAGWGVFTGKARKKGTPVRPLDVAILVVDDPDYIKYREEILDEKMPRWLMHEYKWEANIVYASYEANEIDGILPGLGMLANSHTGLVNLDTEGSLYREPPPRKGPSAGAYSHYQNLTFTVTEDLPAGHELFAHYTDNWFVHRSKEYGYDLPLSGDFEAADRILNSLEHVLSGDLDSEFAHDLWNTTMEAAGPLMSPRLRKALPERTTDLVDMVYSKGSAYNTVPNVIRTTEWLEEHGTCLDNIVTKNTNDSNTGKGAFASRSLKKGSTVAPAPLIHIHRKHLEMYLSHDQGNWKGYQLLLNYCYGHPSSSLLFFPYSPGVNNINHASGKKANVGLRWSEKMNQAELLEYTTEELIERNTKAGLVMEYYALRDIAAGEEIVLDYGDEWQTAWDRHVATWEEPVNAEKYESAWWYDTASEIYTQKDSKYPPSWIGVRCWVNIDILDPIESDGWYEWKSMESDKIDDTIPCQVLDAAIQDGEKESYFIHVVDDNGNHKWIKNVPWATITFVEKPYTSNQHLRQAFRHEIILPDEMIPDSWKDLEEEDGTCGLYMAESAIPNSGMGMFSARQVEKDSEVFHSDVMVPIEDYATNMELRRRFKNLSDTDPLWLLEQYYWNPEVTHTTWEGITMQSMLPGLGMLANSHTALPNVEEYPPERTALLHRGRDPGAGASSHYHGQVFLSNKKIEVGEEIFVRYGDNWFEQREDLGMIPLSDNFEKADEILLRFKALSKEKGLADEVMEEIWKLLKYAAEDDERFDSALPENHTEAMRVAEIGTAKESVPNRIRSIEWLEENGLCIDNIRPEQSTIEQAGRGAFATRKIPKDGIISPMPVVHIRRKHVEVYDEKYDEDEVYRLGTQLIFNYCYGHPTSSLLLFPYAPVVNYVNHNATLANSFIRWSSIKAHDQEWMERSPDSLDEESHAGLAMELVALRDIKPGEEIFLNYGGDWEHAWNKHVQEFKPTDEEKSYVSSTQLNERIEWLRTQEELKLDPYPKNVMTICVAQKHFRNSTGTLDGMHTFTWDDKEIDMYQDIDAWHECDVLFREGDFAPQDAYDRSQSVFPIEMKYTVSLEVGEETIVVTGLPRGAIQFVDTQYSSDIFLRSAFRHEIQMPDAMIPPKWKDL